MCLCFNTGTFKIKKALKKYEVHTKHQSVPHLTGDIFGRSWSVASVDAQNKPSLTAKCSIKKGTNWAAGETLPPSPQKSKQRFDPHKNFKRKSAEKELRNEGQRQDKINHVCVTCLHALRMVIASNTPGVCHEPSLPPLRWIINTWRFLNYKHVPSRVNCSHDNHRKKEYQSEERRSN